MKDCAQEEKASLYETIKIMPIDELEAYCFLTDNTRKAIVIIDFNIEYAGAHNWFGRIYTHLWVRQGSA